MAKQPLIAVVDDEASVRTMLGRLLRLDGYRVVSFSSGEEFLSSLVQDSPCCVLLDIHMPDLSGFDVQARLRTLKADIPVVFITASDDPDLSGKVDEVLGVALLRKPFSSRELSGAIQAALAAHLRDTS
jgi:FixJ family two-component response regulator